MSNTAILVGNSNYDHMQVLRSCEADLVAMEQLLAATEKYDQIVLIEDEDADSLKSKLRAALDNNKKSGEVFFYFTGHGHLHQEELFLCATNFDGKKPNETGLSTAELHTLLRLADAELTVKVVDACYSGTYLIKSKDDWLPQSKEGFRNLIQIASCLDTQNSFTGNPLSVFTDKFRTAAIRKTEGPVFYTDIISTLRDEFIENNTQTPFFVSQHTGREQFVDDAKRLDELRKSTEVQGVRPDAPAEEVAESAITLLDRLRAADAKVVKPDAMDGLVGELFDALIDKVSQGEFGEYFDVEITEHNRFEEPTAEQFIIRVMSNEKRADNFVTATHSRKLRARNPLFGLTGLSFEKYLDEDRYLEDAELHLNCAMKRAQLRIMFTPKFMNLKRIVLVVSCAPSLDHCYVFEVSTEHMLRDFDKFDRDGAELSRRWWRLGWGASSESVVAQIVQRITEAVSEHLEEAEKRLSEC